MCKNEYLKKFRITLGNKPLITSRAQIHLMDIAEFLSLMEGIAPEGLAEEWDRGKIGLVVEGNREVRHVCCAIDATPSVVGRAIASGADVLVVHHTPIWTPVTSVTGPLASLMRDVLSSGMHVYVVHSNFDRAPGGINDALAGLLGLANCRRLSLGVVGDCPLSIPGIARRLDCPVIAWGDPELPGPLSIAGGSAFTPELIGEAVAAGARAFLSADLKHSVARASPLPLLEATHYALESPGMRALAHKMGWTYIDDPPAVRTWRPARSSRD